MRSSSPNRYSTPVRRADRLEESGDKRDKADTRRATGRFRTGLVLVSSAALGGIAIAVWNRRLLRDLRNSLENALEREPDADTSSSED